LPVPAVVVESPLLTPDEAATYLRSHIRTLERWRQRRCGPRYVRLGRRVCYFKTDLEQWAQAQEPVRAA
jgi:excisionase family DNA binding protein